MKLSQDDNGKGIQVLRPTSTEALAVSGTAASGAALTNNTDVLRLCSDVDVFVCLTATATTSNGFLLPAGTVEFIRIDTGDTLSAITAGGSGTLNITEMV